MGRHDRQVIDSDEDRQAWAREVATNIAALPERQACALRLIYNHGLSSREAAGWLSMNLDAFHHLSAQALQRLGVAIAADPVDQLLARAAREAARR
jgi:DNA-directed RNA polymerase specialized sigma24 family protein